MISKNAQMKKLSILCILLAFFNSCITNRNVENKERIFCSPHEIATYILKIDTNFLEIEEIVRTVGVGHYYCKGGWSYVSKKLIIFECDTTLKMYYSVPLFKWNPYSYDEYVKVVSKNKALYVRRDNKIILKHKWCDCVPERKNSLIIGGTENDPNCDCE